MFKVNPLLGYMHMSLAFGWLLLILGGNLETRIYSQNAINPPYYPIFFKFFDPVPGQFLFSKLFEFLMDFLLLFILSGVFLAYFKRFRSSVMGMKRTTKHTPLDRIALTSLWLIFPFRLLAESFTSGAFHHGGFLTGSLGNLFAAFLPVGKLYYPAWWVYSFSLCGFFIALPFSRYMHIPAEALLIFMRNAGIKQDKEESSYAEAEINACSRCGVCIDTCQLASGADISKVQTVYFIRDTRHNTLKANIANNCLMCGRCDQICPVGIDALTLRQYEREKFDYKGAHSFDYIPVKNASKADVIYFAGCMTHLTPTIKIAMEKILRASNEKYLFMDEDGSICCGRPSMLAGQMEAATVLMQKHKEIIQRSGAQTFVTSCPICYKVFTEEYKLDIEVLHHSQFLLRQINEGKIEVNKKEINAVYHDPCELGRGMNIYNEPRTLIRKITALDHSVFETENGLCCGGSIGNSEISDEKRNLITRDALSKMGIDQEQTLITACPLCKRTFAKYHPETEDIAQLVASALKEKKDSTTCRDRNFQKEMIK
jgi:Fe-S oxidoreductase